MSEEKWIREKYFNESTYISAISVLHNNDDLNKVLEILDNIEQYGNENKGPDLISKVNNIIYGIECFEIDSTKNDKKGSKYKQEIGAINSRCKSKIKNKDNFNDTSVLELRQNLECYVENYKKAYKNHYSKISNYLKYLNKDFPGFEKEIWFFIENVTPFGDHYLNKNGEFSLFHPMLSKELIELYEQSTLIHGIIYATGSLKKEKRLFVYFNNEEEIKKLKNECRMESVKSLVSLDISCTTSLIKISKSDVK